MENYEIAYIFRTIGDMLEVKGDESRHRIMAYRRAAGAVLGWEQSMADLQREGRLTDVPGIGEVLAAKIEELLTTGKLEFYERLQAEIPQGVVEMLHIPGVGPRMAARFWHELGITTIDELEAAARAGRLRELSGMGAKSEARVLEGIEALQRQETDRLPLGKAWYIAYRMSGWLRDVPGVVDALPAGSLRRMQDTIGDLDLLVAAGDSAPVMARFGELPEVSAVLLRGPTKMTIRSQSALQVDLRVVEPARWGTALQYFTGSQAHNVRLRELAHRQGYSLSEYALRREEDGSELLFASEKALYNHLGLPWIPPELREDRGEIEAAQAGNLPQLVERSDLQGDLQMHTVASDGRRSIAEMAEAARARGLRYILITDHSHSIGIAGGQTTAELCRQRAEIDALNRQVDDIRILAGTEVEIRADGSLDYPDEVLAEMDLVVAALHTGLRSGRERTTERMLGAIRNPHVDIIAHPTGRLIGRREGADLDMETILCAAAEMGTAIEINAYPDRLDLPDRYVRRAVELGVHLTVSSDAHDIPDLDLLFFGVGVARRGWATAEDVVNTWDVARLLDWAAKRGSTG